MRIITPEKRPLRKHSFEHPGSETLMHGMHSGAELPQSPGPDATQQQNLWVTKAPDKESEPVQDVKETHIPKSSGQALWTPPWLHKISLSGFVCLFTSLWVALVILWRYDVSNSGFPISPSGSRFSWTYGPTAVFVAITGLWRQVDYHSKMHQPWQQMTKGPSPASSSVLLDYISPILPTGLVRSFRNRHWTVAAAISGFAILKLVTVLSTALMVPVPTRMTGPVPIKINSKFNDSTFWTTTSWVLSNKTTSAPSGRKYSHAGYYFNNISTTAATTYLQLLQAQIPDPIGTQQGIVFQDVTISKTPDITEVIAVSVDIDTIVPNVNCEEVNTIFEAHDGNNTRFNGVVEMNIPSCGTSKVWLSQCTDGSDSCPGLTTYNMYRTYCSDSGISNGPQTESRLLLVASNITQGPKPGTQYSDYIFTSKMSSITAVSCKVTYRMMKGTWTTDPMKVKTQVRPSELPDNEKRLANLTDRRLTELLYSALVVADTEMDGPFRDYDHDLRSYTWGNDTAGSAALFELMGHNVRGLPNGYYRLFDGDTMVTSATAVLNQLAVLFIHESFLVADNTTASGEGIYTQERLRFRELSLWLMVASFLVLSLLTLCIMFTFSPAAPQDPSLLGSHAAMLAQSPYFETLLAPLGGCRTSRITYELSGHTFSTVFDGSIFRLQAHEGLATDNSLPVKPKHKKRNWIPTPARVWSVIATFTLPLVAIIGLEILYEEAVDKDGFIIQDPLWALYGIQYSSTLVMLAVASLFNSLDFTVITVSTFSLMRSGAMPSHQTLTNNPMREITPVALYKAVRSRQVGLFSSKLAAMLGSVLTILVSNLWLQKSVITNTNIQVPLTTTWNLDWVNSAIDDGGATTLLNNVGLNNTQSPGTAIWNDLVFPTFGAITISSPDGPRSAFDFSTSNRNLNFSIEVPSLRPRLFCQQATDVNWGVNSVGGFIRSNMTATFPFPEGCRAEKVGNRKDISFTGLEDKTFGLMGLFFDLLIGDKVSKECSPCTTKPETRPDNPMGCPSIGILFAKKALVCTQVIQQVQVQLHFEAFIGSNGEFVMKKSNLTSAPTPIESTATNLTRGSTGLESFNYRIQPHFDLNITNTVADDSVDPFFGYLLSGTSGFTRGNLNKSTDLLISAVSGLYTDFMVQVIDSNIFRKPSEQMPLENQQNFAKGTVSTEASRLSVNYTSKLTVQIVLGVMVVFGLAALLLVDLKRTLPRSPHSIASVMALFAGSKLCSDVIPEGAEWFDKQQLDRLFGGYMFALGWWSSSATEAELRSIDSLMIAPLVEKRYGIDIGTPERFGFSMRGDRDKI